jgi:hypothetical protein
LRSLLEDELVFERILCIRNETKLPSTISEVQIILLNGGELELCVHASDGYRFAKPEEFLLQRVREWLPSVKQPDEKWTRILESVNYPPVPAVDRKVGSSLFNRCRRILHRRVPRLELFSTRTYALSLHSGFVCTFKGRITMDESYAFLTDVVMDLEKDGFRVLSYVPYPVKDHTVYRPAYEPVVLRQYHEAQAIHS